RRKQGGSGGTTWVCGASVCVGHSPGASRQEPLRAPLCRHSAGARLPAPSPDKCAPSPNGRPASPPAARELRVLLAKKYSNAGHVLISSENGTFYVC
uniref:Uncharacterized protein n=1 Tax=Anas platyrhynchos platyrhynchos TaxID=8840 RepID=A0A493TKH4_ANAPP